jgi:hypothetical protein
MFSCSWCCYCTCLFLLFFLSTYYQMFRTFYYGIVRFQIAPFRKLRLHETTDAIFIVNIWLFLLFFYFRFKKKENCLYRNLVTVQSLLFLLLFPVLIISKDHHSINLLQIAYQPQICLLAFLTKVDSDPFLPLNIDWNADVLSLLLCYQGLVTKRNLDFRLIF